MLVNYNSVINYSKLFSFIGAILYCLGRIIHQDTNNDFITSILSSSLSIIMNLIITISGFISIFAWYNSDILNIKKLFT